MIIYEEEYRVKTAKIKEWEKNLLEFDKIIKSLDAPFLKGWYVWQDKFVPGLIKNVWVLDELSDVDRLRELCLVKTPEWADMVPRIFETMIDGTYKVSFWKPVSNEDIVASLK